MLMSMLAGRCRRKRTSGLGSNHGGHGLTAQFCSCLPCCCCDVCPQGTRAGRGRWTGTWCQVPGTYLGTCFVRQRLERAGPTGALGSPGSLGTLRDDPGMIHIDSNAFLTGAHPCSKPPTPNFEVEK